MRRALALLGIVLGTGSAQTALAAPPGTPTRPAHESERSEISPEDDDPSDGTEGEGLNASRIAVLRHERDDIHRGLPIALLVVGGVVGVTSLELTMLQGLRGMGDSSTPPPAGSPTGLYVASGVGFAAAAVGLVWLIDCNQQRGEIEDRIERLSSHSRRAGTLVLPAADPGTKTWGVTLFQRF